IGPDRAHLSNETLIVSFIRTPSSPFPILTEVSSSTSSSSSVDTTVWIAMFGLKKPLERLSKHHKPSSSASASKSNPFDSVDESDGNKKHTLKPSNKISPQPSLPTTKKNHGFNPFDDVVEKRLKPSFKNHFRESGGVENQTVQELESYAVYKSEETTKTVPGISSARDKISLSSKQGEKITRTHHKAVDIDHDLTRGEKLLGSLGGIFSRTWKPKKTRSITGPVITRGESRKRRVNNLETREKLGLNHLPKPDSRANEPLPESADAYQKIERKRERMSQRIHKLTKELSVEIQVSFFEEANNAHYNSVSIGYVDEVTSVFIGSCIFLMGQQPQPQTTYNLSNASICAFVLTVCVSFNKAFYRILINGNTLSISKYKNRDNWQYQPVDQARPEDWSVQFEVRERQIERYITLNIVCSWVTNGLSLKLKDDLLKLKNPSLESVKT
ncbi:hypothetical protein HID58_006995, partial [Brassica napus]